MSRINLSIPEPSHGRTAALRGQAWQHPPSNSTTDDVAQREHDEFRGASRGVGPSQPQVAASMAPRCTPSTDPCSRARETLEEYCEVSQMYEAWGLHVVEQLADLRRLTLDERGKGAAQALFDIYYSADDMGQFRVHSKRPTLMGLPLKLEVIRRDLDEAQAVVAKLQKNMAKAEGVLASADVLEQTSYLNQAYARGLDFLNRYVKEMLVEERFFSHLVNQSAQSFKPMLCMRQLDICAPFATLNLRGQHRLHRIASPAVLNDVTQSLALLAAKPSEQGHARPARPTKTLRQAVQESGALHLAELAQSIELEQCRVDEGLARASRTSATTRSAHEADNFESGEESEKESENWWSSQTAPCESIPAQESAWDLPAPAKKDRPKYKPRRLRVQKQAPTVTVPSAPTATISPAGRQNRVDPVVTLGEKSRQTLTLLLHKPYRQGVTVQDYLHLLTEFIQRGRACGYLKHVQHMQEKNNRRDGFDLNLGIGESLYFVRFDGKKCWASFHYPHDRDGHNHTKVPKEYRAAYTKVFENFSVPCA